VLVYISGGDDHPDRVDSGKSESRHGPAVFPTWV
jgi:hypothetical protein